MRRITIYSILMAFVIFVSVVSAHATVITFDYEIEFSGATPPTGAAPWLTATFNDMDTTGSVNLTLSTAGLVGSEYVDEWVFNFNPDLALSLLSINQTSGTTASISLGENSFKADGGGRYDILFDFPQSNGSRFGAGQTAIFSINDGGADLLMASSFNFLGDPSGSHGPYISGAHVQAIDDASCPTDEPNCESGWVAVPEMQSFYFLGITLVGLIASKRKMKG